MSQGTSVRMSLADRCHIQAIVADRNSRQKHVWRAMCALAAADGHGTTTFPERTRRRLRRGSVPSPIALQVAINRFVREHNERPGPFVWTAGPDAIVEKVRRGHHALGSMEQWAG
ncbi:MAG: hypothetical protein WAS21_09685 [Geminicoccaceae bacterium]